VDSLTFGSLLSTRETVLREVFAARATSLMLACFMGVGVVEVSWNPLAIDYFRHSPESGMMEQDLILLGTYP
jgi:hypothetical protein